MNDLLSPTHWRSMVSNRPLCGAPPDAEQTQLREDVSCSRCLWHLQEARKRRHRG